MLFGKKKETVVTILLVVGISLAMFWPFRNNFFVYDDFAMIEHVIAGPMAVLKGYNNILRVVSSCFLWPLYAISGHDPFGYNMFCLSLYAFNGVLFYFFCKKLFNDSLLASWAAVLYVATSVGADAIFWKAAYSTLLNVTFYLLTLITYLEFRKKGLLRYYWISVIIFLLAVLSKEESASLPFIIVAIELLVLNGKIDRVLIKRLVPYCLLIVSYLVVNYIIIYHVLHGQSELVKNSQFRPLHTLFAPWTAFFLAPDGRLSISDIRIYVTALFVPLAIFFARDRKLFLFALAWVFLTFLPQSLCNLSHFEPKYIFNSVSRHLYLPSAGVALAFAFLILRVKSLVPAKAFSVIGVLFLAGYFSLNYYRFQERGRAWDEEGIPVKTFLGEIKKVIPEFPPRSYVFVIDAPTGRAYVQQSLRAFYMNPTITWIVDPTTFVPQPGSSAFLITCNWRSQYDMDVSAQKVF